MAPATTDASALSRVIDAIDLAARAHHGQLRKGPSGAPYVVHPLRVMRNLVAFGGINHPDVLCAAALHDVLEDCDTPSSVIEEHFGPCVLSLVRELTKAPGLEGEPSKLAVIAAVPSMSADAQAIKLADVLANVYDMRTDPAPSWNAARRAGYLWYALGVLAAMPAPHAALAAALMDEVRAFQQSAAQSEGGAQ